MAKQPSAGRPTKLTAEVQEKIVQALRAGNFRVASCWFAGISPRVMREWMALGKTEKKGPHYDFRRAVMEAENTAEIGMVTKIMSAAQGGNVKAAMWWLEHKKKRWTKKVEVAPIQVNANMKVEKAHDLSRLSDDELDQYERLLRKATADAEGDSGGDGEAESG